MPLGIHGNLCHLSPAPIRSRAHTGIVMVEGHGVRGTNHRGKVGSPRKEYRVGILNCFRKTRIG